MVAAYSKKGDLEHAEADFNESLHPLFSAQTKKKSAPKMDPRVDWKPRSSLSYELKKSVTSVFSVERINGLSPVEELIQEPRVSVADAVRFKTNMQTFRTALINAVGAIADARTAIEQFSESAPDKKSICVADWLALKQQEGDVLKGLTKLKKDIAAAAAKTEAVSGPIREELIDKSAKEYVVKQDSCPSKEKFLFEIKSELAPYSAFDGVDEPL